MRSLRRGTCDRCRMAHAKCPGVIEHCRSGLHCTSTSFDCASDTGINDHPEKCCLCGFGLTKNQRGPR